MGDVQAKVLLLTLYINVYFVSRVYVLRSTGGKAEAGADKAGECEASMVASIARFVGGIDRENSQRIYYMVDRRTLRMQDYARLLQL